MPVVIADEEIPVELSRFKLPEAVEARLHTLLDRQDQGTPLTEQERAEAEGLVNLAEFLTLLRLRAERAARRATSSHLGRRDRITPVWGAVIKGIV